jgi:phage terminase large subunit-like protein
MSCSGVARETYPRTLRRYARDVLRGRVVAGELVRLACARAARDHADPSSRGLMWREDRARRVLDFFPLLRHFEGRWSGLPFALAPWQEFILAELFGWYRADGRRRFRHAHIEIARKNGKTTMLGGIGLYLMIADGESGAQVYTAATKRDQASIMHRAAIQMVRASNSLSRRLTVFKNSISDPASASSYLPLGADSKTLDGLNVHGALIDELHAHPSGDLYEVLDTATGARVNPLVLSITTAGDDHTSFCYSQREHAEQVLRGVFVDDSLFAFVASLDDGDDWSDPNVWRKANPNLGVTVLADDLAAKAEQAKQAPHRQNHFRRYHANQWVRQVTRWLDLGRWDECAGDELPAEIEARCAGRVGYAGLDLASTTDVCALCIVFPPDDLDAGTFDAIWRFWIPEDGLSERVRQSKVPFDRWEREGWVIATPGNVTDYREVRAEIIHACREKFCVKQLAFDPWNASSLSSELADEGFELVKFPQNYANISAPTKELEKLILSGRIRHGGHPIARWMADNLEVREHDGAIRPVKPNNAMSHKKIDGMVALIMALDRAMRRPSGASNVYEQRGVLLI